jgi:hypothetical protein
MAQRECVVVLVVGLLLFSLGYLGSLAFFFVSLTSLFIHTHTYCHVHQVTLPAMIEQNAAYMMAFLFFALASLIVWTNLLTAVVFQSYNERAEGDALDLYMQAHVGCAVGFMLLSR